MEADLKTAVQFLLDAHNDDSQRGTGRTRTMIDRILTRFVMMDLGEHAVVLVHNERFIDLVANLLVIRAEAMGIEVTGTRSNITLVGADLHRSRVCFSTKLDPYRGYQNRDVFEDHHRFSLRLARLLIAHDCGI